MPIQLLQALIVKQETFEIVRDQIAALLAAETANQMALAALALQDPTEWKLRIFTERSNAWSQFQERDVDDQSPVVNVWYESSTFSGTRGNVIERQEADGRFNIDVVAYGESKDNALGGHTPGDKEAALNLARALRLVRNILMASQNTYLQLPRGVVGLRWPESVTQYQPEGTNATQIAAARIILRVDFNEFSPQYEGPALAGLFAEIKRKETGEIYIEAEYTYPLPP